MACLCGYIQTEQTKSLVAGFASKRFLKTFSLLILSLAIIMCRSENWKDVELWSPRLFPNGEPTSTALVSQVAVQLAQIGDKMDVNYRQKKKESDQTKLNIKNICTFALFVAFRVLI